jgi:hypothetical protein
VAAVEKGCTGQRWSSARAAVVSSGSIDRAAAAMVSCRRAGEAAEEMQLLVALQLRNSSRDSSGGELQVEQQW